MKIWQGACVVQTFPARRLLDAKAEFPKAMVVAHPECPEAVLRACRFTRLHVRNYRVLRRESRARVHRHDRRERVNFSLERVAPRKKFHYVKNENCNCSECPFMRLNTLEKLRDALLNLEPRVELSEDVMRRALIPIERMLAVK